MLHAHATLAMSIWSSSRQELLSCKPQDGQGYSANVDTARNFGINPEHNRGGPE